MSSPVLTGPHFAPPASLQSGAHISSLELYRELHRESLADPEAFWSRMARRLVWSREWDRVADFDFHRARIRWFEGGRLNASVNCLDRHVAAGHGDRLAYLWESNDPEEPNRRFTYAELLREVEQFGNVLRARGVRKGDRVCLYLQMIPELPIAMLACARIRSFSERSAPSRCATASTTRAARCW